MLPLHSGWRIYETIRDLMEELKELQTTSEIVKDRFGAYSTAHNLINEAIQKKEQELAEFGDAKYSVHQKPNQS